MKCAEATKGALARIGDVFLHVVEYRDGWLIAHCYVKSESERDICYFVTLKLRVGTRYFTGRCECPDFKYRGGPCKHIVKAKVAVREYLKVKKRFM